MISEERCFLLPAGVVTASWRRALGIVSPVSPKTTTTEWIDTFFDTRDGRFGRTEYRLRRRIRGRSCRWQLLAGTRLIIDQPAVDTSPRAQAVSCIQGRATLFPLIEVAITQRIHQINTSPRVRLRIREEQWRFRDPLETADWLDGPHVLCLEGSSAAALAPAATALSSAGLPPLPSDPMTIGLAAIGAAVPGAALPEEYHLQAEDSAETAIRKNLAKQGYRMWTNTRGALHDLDPEFVHDLRVATRRARFALRLAAHGAEKSWASALRAELVWIAGLLGAVRDYDVFLQSLPHYFRRAETPPAVRAFVRRHFRSRRAQAQLTLAAALQSDRYRALLSQVCGALTGKRITIPELRPQLAVELSAKTIAKAARRVRRWEPDTTDPAAGLHRLRIAGKRLRYTAEFFAELYDGRLEPLIQQATKMQDLLGAHQDAKVAAATFLALAEHTTTPGHLLAIGALVQAQREVMFELRRRFEDRWPRMRKRLKVARFRLTQPRDGC